MRTLLSSLLCLALVAVTTGCDATDADLPTADAATVTEIPIDGSINFCGDEVFFDGTIKEVVHIRGDGNGGFHLAVNANLKVKGVDNSGNEYNGSENFHLNFNAKAGATLTQLITTKLVGKGSAPDYTAVFHIHFTVNANGDVTSDFVRADAECK